MTWRLSYTFIKGWVKPGERAEPAWWEKLPFAQRLLLLSDGSMTINLELFSGAGERVEADVMFSGVCALDADTAACLEEAVGKPALKREVWLKAGGKRLICARTVIPIDNASKGLIAVLEDEKDPQPLGRILRDRNIAFAKDKIELSVLSCPRVCGDTGLPDSTPLTARRYVLFTKPGDAGLTVKAAVTEIFSPELIAAPRMCFQ